MIFMLNKPAPGEYGATAMAKRQRTPREKKRLSYEKDRRRIRTSNNKAPRKFVPRRRAQGHRAARRMARIPPYLASDEQILEQAEGRFDLKTRTRWRKWSDRPLAEHIDDRTWRRTVGREGRKRDSKLRRLLWELETAERNGYCGVAFDRDYRMPPRPYLVQAGLALSPHPERSDLVVVGRLRHGGSI